MLTHPEAMLRQLCAALNLEFLPAMLSWEPGLRATDGVWAKHWYPEVETSTGFRPPRSESAPVPKRLRGVYDECLDVYKRLYAHRILPSATPEAGL